MEDQKEIHLASEYTKGGYGQYDEEIEQCIREEFALKWSGNGWNLYRKSISWNGTLYRRLSDFWKKRYYSFNTGGTPLFYDWLGTQKKDLGRL